MSWRGIDGGIAAARARHNVVMTPGAYCYFDHYQGNKNTEPLAIGGYTTVDKVYSYEPVPKDSLASDFRSFILGAQGNVWTEYISTPEQVEYMALPRMCALAEVLWSQPEKKDYFDFRRRLLANFKLLDQLNVNYSKAIYDVKARINPSKSGVAVDLQKDIPEGEIHYTLDGSIPNISSPMYTGPVDVSADCKMCAAIFDKDSMRSHIYSQIFDIHLATGKSVNLMEAPNPSYSKGGAQSLTDGVMGARPVWSGAEWLGWWGADMTATIDMGEGITYQQITLDVLQDKASWIYFPSEVEVYTSSDNLTYKIAATATTAQIEQSAGHIMIKVFPSQTRYIRVVAKNKGNIPIGQPGAGEKAWLFVDEIMVD
jgi:hexosaminidase